MGRERPKERQHRIEARIEWNETLNELSANRAPWRVRHVTIGKRSLFDLFLEEDILSTLPTFV